MKLLRKVPESLTVFLFEVTLWRQLSKRVKPSIESLRQLSTQLFLNSSSNIRITHWIFFKHFYDYSIVVALPIENVPNNYEQQIQVVWIVQRHEVSTITPHSCTSKLSTLKLANPFHAYRKAIHRLSSCFSFKQEKFHSRMNICKRLYDFSRSNKCV